MSHFPLWCRTPLVFDVNGTFLTIHLEAAPGAAGADGQNLLPGQAAWVDRALSPQEPRTIAVQPRYLREDLTFIHLVTLFGGVQQASALTAALLTPDTLIRFMLSNTGSNLEYVDSTPHTSTSGFGPITIRAAKRG